ncbi:flagellar export protein FliJ [Paenibacillus sp. R14(2021)]|uniref:flagellar export protein FliJ n=1 Tax=Paenibacillus sp. R14(2021) TaxID=2859228 RepID=UPI001C6123BF|nr:flagellar export protein FliJ [Paenibacillus sp. R14(2021)]
MSRFQYAFQKIVDLKVSEKSQAEWQLSVVVGKLMNEEQLLQKLHQERASWCERLQEASIQSVSLSEVMTMQAYIDHLDNSIICKLRDVRQAQAAVDESRSFLSERVMDEKVWQKTKENAFQRFRADMMVKEQHALDELATVRFMYSAP